MRILRRTPLASYSDQLTVSITKEDKLALENNSYDVVIITHPTSNREYRLNPQRVLARLRERKGENGFNGYAFNYVALFEVDQKRQQYSPEL